MTAPSAKQKSLTPEQVRFIREVRDIASIGKLAHKIGVHRDTVRRVWNGETHRGSALSLHHRQTFNLGTKND